MSAILLFVQLMGYYFLVGLLFGIYFGISGAKRMDAKIGASKWYLRLLVVPGAIILWPLLMVKLFSKKQSS